MFDCCLLARHTADRTLLATGGVTALVGGGRRRAGLRLLALQDVRVAPDVREADGGVEAEEDGHRDAAVGDDAPLQRAVEVRVERYALRLLQLERVGDPQRDVAEQEEGDELATRLGVHLRAVGRPPAKAVEDEDDLQRRLHDVERDARQRQHLQHVVVEDVGEAGDYRERVVHAEAEERHVDEHVLEVLLHRREAQQTQATEAEQDGDAGAGEQRDLGDEEHVRRRVLARHVRRVLVVKDEEEHVDGDDHGGEREEAEEEALVRLVAVGRVVLVQLELALLVRLAVLLVAPDVPVDLVGDGGGDEAVLDRARVEVLGAGAHQAVRHRARDVDRCRTRHNKTYTHTNRSTIHMS